MFKSDYYLTPFNNRMDQQEAYTRTNAFITYTTADDKLDIGAFVNNIEDTRIITYAGYLGNPVNIYNWIFGAPRLIGGRVAYRF